MHKFVELTGILQQRINPQSWVCTLMICIPSGSPYLNLKVEEILRYESQSLMALAAGLLWGFFMYTRTVICRSLVVCGWLNFTDFPLVY